MNRFVARSSEQANKTKLQPEASFLSLFFLQGHAIHLLDFQTANIKSQDYSEIDLLNIRPEKKNYCHKTDSTLTWTNLPNFPLVLHLQASPATVQTASSPCAPPTGGLIPVPVWPAAWASRTTSLSSAHVAAATRALPNPARETRGRTRWSHIVQEELFILPACPPSLS